MKVLGPDLSLRQKEIIAGTILGGSSIVKPKGGRNCYLSMRDRNAQWLEYKAASIKCLASTAPFTLPKSGNTYRWHSMCYPIFGDYSEMFYLKNKRHLRPDALDPLKDLGLSVWFVDCGKFVNDEIILNTSVWGKKGSRIARAYFQALGYSVMMTKERGGYRIRLDCQSSSEFLKIVTPPLPEFVEIMR